jgi:hypothetical protein
VATACVAALIAVVGVVVCNVLDIRLVRPALLVDVLHGFAGDYALTVFVLTLVATAIAHLVALTTPRPRMFFTWIVLLATVVAVVTPFAVGDDVTSQTATACINLVVGLCVVSLLGGVMSRTVRVRQPALR